MSVTSLHKAVDRAMPFLPMLTMLGAWAATTVVGATIMMLPGGEEALRSFLLKDDPIVGRHLGSPTYIVLLLLPMVAVPVFGLLGIKAGRRMVPAIAAARLDGAELRPAAAWGLLAAIMAYCLWHLAARDALFPGILGSNDYIAAITERVRLMDELPFLFYALFYAALPVLCSAFLARLVERRHPLDAAGLLLAYLFFCYLTFATYLKAPILVMVIMLSTTIIVARASIFLAAPIIVISVMIVLTMQMLIGGITRGDHESLSLEVSNEVLVEGWNEAPPTMVNEPPPTMVDAGLATARSIAFRMSSAFPYYVAIFSDPVERCGIDTNNLPLLPRPECVMPTKVFARMYPRVRWTTGYAPAAAHVSAYGEVGLVYAGAVAAASGLLLGLLGALGAAGRGAFHTTLMASSCVFGYYLSQVSFIGALTYSHGLLFFLVPLALLVGGVRRQYSSGLAESS